MLRAIAHCGPVKGWPLVRTQKEHLSKPLQDVFIQLIFAFKASFWSGESKPGLAEGIYLIWSKSHSQTFVLDWKDSFRVSRKVRARNDDAVWKRQPWKSFYLLLLLLKQFHLFPLLELSQTLKGKNRFLSTRNQGLSARSEVSSIFPDLTVVRIDSCWAFLILLISLFRT